MPTKLQYIFSIKVSRRNKKESGRMEDQNIDDDADVADYDYNNNNNVNHKKYIFAIDIRSSWLSLGSSNSRYLPS
jgi:hypothetical protein